MLASRITFGIAAAVMGCSLAFQAPALAQAGPDSTVTVKIRRHPRVSLQVVPRGVGVCKRPGADCLNEVTWKAGPGANGLGPGEYIVISHKPGDEGSSVCFPSTSFRFGADHPQTTSGAVQDACKTPTAWFYSVELWSDSGTPTDPSDDVRLCDPLDPGVIIDSFAGP